MCGFHWVFFFLKSLVLFGFNFSSLFFFSTFCHGRGFLLKQGHGGRTSYKTNKNRIFVKTESLHREWASQVDIDCFKGTQVKWWSCLVNYQRIGFMVLMFIASRTPRWNYDLVLPSIKNNNHNHQNKFTLAEDMALRVWFVERLNPIFFANWHIQHGFLYMHQAVINPLNKWQLELTIPVYL